MDIATLRLLAQKVRNTDIDLVKATEVTRQTEAKLQEAEIALIDELVRHNHYRFLNIDMDAVDNLIK